MFEKFNSLSVNKSKCDCTIKIALKKKLLLIN